MTIKLVTSALALLCSLKSFALTIHNDLSTNKKLIAITLTQAVIIHPGGTEEIAPPKRGPFSLQLYHEKKSKTGNLFEALVIITQKENRVVERDLDLLASELVARAKMSLHEQKNDALPYSAERVQ